MTHRYRLLVPLFWALCLNVPWSVLAVGGARRNKKPIAENPVRRRNPRLAVSSATMPQGNPQQGTEKSLDGLSESLDEKSRDISADSEKYNEIFNQSIGFEKNVIRYLQDLISSQKTLEKYIKQVEDLQTKYSYFATQTETEVRRFDQLFKEAVSPENISDEMKKISKNLKTTLDKAKELKKEIKAMQVKRKQEGSIWCLHLSGLESEIVNWKKGKKAHQEAPEQLIWSLTYGRGQISEVKEKLLGIRQTLAASIAQTGDELYNRITGLLSGLHNTKESIGEKKGSRLGLLNKMLKREKEVEDKDSSPFKVLKAGLEEMEAHVSKYITRVESRNNFLESEKCKVCCISSADSDYQVPSDEKQESRLQTKFDDTHKLIGGATKFVETKIKIYKNQYSASTRLEKESIEKYLKLANDYEGWKDTFLEYTETLKSSPPAKRVRRSSATSSTN